MEKKFSVQNEFTLKKRIDISRIFMGRSYPTFLILAVGVILYNYYLISTGRGAEGDVKKTITLVVLMVVWAYIPVVWGFIQHKTSGIKNQTVDIYNDKVVVTDEKGTRELPPSRFYSVIEKENYIRFGSLGETVVIEKSGVTLGDPDEIVKFLYNMKAE